MSARPRAGGLPRRHFESVETGVAPALYSRRTPVPVALLGVAFDPVTTDQALERIDEMVRSRRPHYVVTANVDFLVQALRDVELRRILIEAPLVLCDGTPLVWASCWLGYPLPERVAGSDLVPRLIRQAAQKKHRLFFLGAAPDANAEAVARVRAQHPGVIIAGHYSPPCRPLLDMDHDEIVRQIRAAEPDVVLVAFGCPKAEKWMAMHYRDLKVPVMIGVGGTLDFLAGRVKRAPVWMQRTGIEWLHRLWQEPRRLFRRYATDLGCFGWAFARQWWRLLAFPSWPGEFGDSAGPLPLGLAATRGFAASDCGEVSAGNAGLIVQPPSRESEQNWHRIRLAGRLDAGVFRSSRWLERCVEGEGCLLDLSEVTSVDSAGLGFLVQFRKRLVAAGKRLVLLAPGRRVRQALRWFGLGDFFATVDDAHEARPFFADAEGPWPVRYDAASRFLNWRGEITAANTVRVWALTGPLLEELAFRSSSLTIDLSQVTFIDTAGIALMVRARKLVERAGATLAFTGARRDVRDAARLAKLDGAIFREAA